MSKSVVVVCGALGNKPGNGGEAWVVLTWVRGLSALGFDVWFVEELGRTTDDLAASIEGLWFHDVTQRHGVGGQAVLISGDQVMGADDLKCVRDLIHSSKLVVNISGNLRRPDLLAAARLAAYVDLDPGFTQIWHANGVGDLRLDQHHLHFTVGENIGRPMCPLPTGDIDWIPARQPVILDDWPVTPVPPAAALSTVATWRCPFGPLEWDGVTYGLKIHEFRKIIDLPRRVPVPLELALAIHEGDAPDRTRLLASGWSLRDAPAVAGSPENFRRYVQSSMGEFTVAQGVYAQARTGWFSDRTLRYLASGRPAIVQDTGWEPSAVGEGLITFDGIDTAQAAIETICDDVDLHSKAARQFTEEHFAADVVLTRFVERCQLSS